MNRIFITLWPIKGRPEMRNPSITSGVITGIFQLGMKGLDGLYFHFFSLSTLAFSRFKTLSAEKWLFTKKIFVFIIGVIFYFTIIPEGKPVILNPSSSGTVPDGTRET